MQLEEELRHKITEVSRQLAGKEEEVLNVKKRFKEEKTALEHDKKKALAQMNDAVNKLEAADQRFYAYKQEVETSPLNVLRNELAPSRSRLWSWRLELEWLNKRRWSLRKNIRIYRLNSSL